jgi:four helix bundle protein
VTHKELCDRSLGVAVRSAAAAEPLLSDPALRHAADQVIRASSSAASNYRAAGQARSHREFTAKLGVAVEEADEAVFWWEYIIARSSSPPHGAAVRLDESEQLARILAASRNTARRRSGRDTPIADSR